MRGRASLLIALAICAGCDVAELAPQRDTTGDDGRQADAADTSVGDAQPTLPTVAPDAQGDIAPTLVIEREPCGPCDAARTRACVGGACEPWSDCVIGTCRPQGLLCGLRVDEEVVACDGHDPAASCPEGYGAIEVAGLGDVLTTCALEAGNCEGAECEPARLPATAVCGISHNGTQMGTACAGAVPAQDACPLGMSWSGRTDFGARAGFGVQVCVAVAGARPIEGLCGWAHTRSSLSGDGRFWCAGSVYQTCPQGCTRLGPTDTGSGEGHGWMTCGCPL